MADMDIVAKDQRFSLVRLKSGQNFDDLAQVFLGDARERWQIEEVNANHHALGGQIVAVPLQTVNSTSVYSDGFRILPILCYHRFTADSKSTHQLELSAAVFDQQLQYLVDNGYQFLSFADIQTIWQNGGPIPDKAVVISIDDGYRSVYDIAWPILKKYKARATLFVYTDFIGAPAALTWQQMKEMAASGSIEIESHAKSHSSLSRLPVDISHKTYQARVQAEIKDSNSSFERHLGRPATYLSYPYGNSSIVVSHIAGQEGIVMAATVTRGDNPVFADPYLLHRTMIYNTHDMQDFVHMLRSFKDMKLQ